MYPYKKLYQCVSMQRNRGRDDDLIRQAMKLVLGEEDMQRFDDMMLALSRWAFTDEHILDMPEEVLSLHIEKTVKVMRHYDVRAKESIGEDRSVSESINVRKVNNFVKAEMINGLVRSGDKVLDLAGGKGGDLIKYRYAKIRRYVLVDISCESVKEARERYDNMYDRPFDARFVCQDVLEYSDQDEYDAVAMQFALHYFCDSEASMRRLLELVSSRLKTGGVFFGITTDRGEIFTLLKESDAYDNRLMRLRRRYATPLTDFGAEYVFTLKGCVHECPEYLVPFERIEKMAESYGMKLFTENLYDAFVKRKGSVNMKRMKVPQPSSLSSEEVRVLEMYRTFVLKK